MIVATLLALLFSVLNIATFFLDPITELPLGLNTALTTIYALVHAGTLIFPPLGLLMVYLTLGFSIEFGYQGYQVVRRIINWMRGAG